MTESQVTNSLLDRKNTKLEEDDTFRFPYYLNDKNLTKEESISKYTDWIEKVLTKELSTKPTK